MSIPPLHPHAQDFNMDTVAPLNHQQLQPNPQPNPNIQPESYNINEQIEKVEVKKHEKPVPQKPKDSK